MKKYIAIAVGVLVMAVIYLLATTISLRKANSTYKSNQQALLEKVDYYKTEAGKSAASVQKLELSYSELEDNYQTVCDAADELNIKLKRIEATSTTAIKTEVKIQTVVKDSIIYHSALDIDTVKRLRWRDAWVDISGYLLKDSLNLNVQSSDTIVQIIHRVPKKFWFIKYGTKAIRQEMISTNPHTAIVYTEYIDLKKK